MPKTLAELRESPHVGPTERSMPICLAGKLLGEIDALDEELRNAVEDERAAAAGRKRMATKSRAKQLAAEIDKKRAEMEEHVVMVRVRRKDNGEWRRWCEEHPAREDNDGDTNRFGGFCNHDDLIEELGSYVVGIGAETANEDDWKFISAGAAHGDLVSLAQLVASMQEMGVDIPKSRTAWLNEVLSETDSE